MVPLFSLKIAWLKQHSAPTAGVSFSPSSDKVCPYTH